MLEDQYIAKVGTRNLRKTKEKTATRHNYILNLFIFLTEYHVSICAFSNTIKERTAESSHAIHSYPKNVNTLLMVWRRGPSGRYISLYKKNRVFAEVFILKGNANKQQGNRHKTADERQQTTALS